MQGDFTLAAYTRSSSGGVVDRESLALRPVLLCTVLRAKMRHSLEAFLESTLEAITENVHLFELHSYRIGSNLYTVISKGRGYSMEGHSATVA